MADNRSFSVGRVLGRTFTIWGSNIVTLTILSAIIYSPVLLHAALAFPRPGEDATRFVQVQNVGQFVLSLMATAAVIHGVFQQLRGQPIKIGACLRVCLGRFFPVLGVALLIVLIIVVCALPIVFAFSATGLAFLAVAAAMVVFILLYCMFWVAVPAAVVEKPGVGASLTRSQALTKGNRFAIFLVLLVIAASGQPLIRRYVSSSCFGSASSASSCSGVSSVRNSRRSFMSVTRSPISSPTR